MMKREWLLLSVVVTMLLFGSCNTDSKEYIPDVSDISVHYDVVRFEEIMAQIDTLNVAVDIDSIRNEYPEFTAVFFNNVLPFVGETEEDFYNNLRGYLGDNRIRKLQDTVALVFSDYEQTTQPALDEAMRFMKYYFHDFVAPNMYTFISEYTYQKFIFEDGDKDGIGIGLDMFLGSNYNYKKIDPKNPAFSDYITRTFDKKYIPKMVAEILVNDRVGRPPGSRLLDQMIHNGKQLYILKKILPTSPDSIIFEYTMDQMKWVKENELEMWAFFFDQNLFYESNAMKINKYLNPSPSSPGMPPAAPGRTANYIGYQIVRAYMKRNPKTTLDDLIAIKDAQAIMDKSRYKPKQKK